MSARTSRPPLLASLILKMVLPKGVERDSILGDLWQEHAQRVLSGTRLSAWLWYWRQALGLAGRWLITRLSISRGAGRRRGGSFFDNRARDVVVAARQIRRKPAFAALVVLTLAFGIGPNVAIFSVLKAVVFEPFPWPEPSEVVHVFSTDVGRRYRDPSSIPDYLDLRERNRGFEELGAYTTLFYNIGGDEPHRIQGIAATAGALRAFGVEPALGRLYTDAEEAVAARVVVISYGLWTRQYAGDPDLLGKEIRVNGENHELVGIMPADFDFFSPWFQGQPYELWTPLVVDEAYRVSRSSYSYLMVGRLRDGVSWLAATAEVGNIALELAAEYPDTNARTRFWVMPAVVQMIAEPAGTMAVLFGTVGFVLLIACANVASMLLAKGAGRQTEVAVRVSLGAGRSRIIGQLLTESVLLSLLGGVGGVALAVWSLGALRALIPVDIPRTGGIAIDAPVLAFTFGLTLFTALVFGLAPALTAVRTSIVGALKEGGGSVAGVGTRDVWLRRFAIAQIAVTLVLTYGAVILFQSYRNLLSTPHAFDTEQALTAEIWLWGPHYEGTDAKVRFWERLVQQLEAVPGVEHAAATSKLPLQGGTSVSYLVNDEVFDRDASRRSAERSVITPGYFDAIGIPLLEGRTLREIDNDSAEYGVVVNRTLAEDAWPDESALGKPIRGADWPPRWTAVVVGVVEDVRQWSERQPRPEIYFPLASNIWQRTRLVVRTSGDPLAVLPQVRAEVAGIDADLPLAEERTMGALFAETTRHRRFLTLLVDLFTLTAVVLAVAGIYGNMSYHVVQRTHEIGVRVALGAGRGDLLRMVLRHALRLAAVGVVIGLIMTFNLSFFAGHLAYEIRPLDPVFLIGGTLFVIAVALLAAGIPALRATRVDPIQALRTE